jgi:lysozyme family protein
MRKEIVDWIYMVEGGYVDDPDDRGGKTNMGITHYTLRAAYDRGIVGYTDVRQLTEEDGEKIYDVMYYQASKASKMEAPLDVVHFDAAVNHGLKNAGRMLQISINDLFENDEVEEDGAVGPATLAALSSLIEGVDVEAVINTYLLHRSLFYTRLVNRDRSQMKFFRGWMNRVGKLKSFVEEY